MNNTVHIQVQIIHFLPIRIGTRRVDRDFLSVDLIGKFFDDGRDNLGVFVREPSEKRRDTHYGDAKRSMITIQTRNAMGCRNRP